MLQKYKFVNELAQTPAAKLFLVEGEADGVTYVQKKMKAFGEKKPSTDLIKGTIQEIRIMTRVKHRHTIGLVDWYTEGEHFVLILEYAKLGDLKAMIETHINTSQHMPQEQIFLYAGHMLMGLAFTHEQGIIHRDIKPMNLFICSDRCLKVGDFGVCAVTGSTEEGMPAGDRAGTRCYMAPEMLNLQAYSFVSDTFSAGNVLYEMLTLEQPIDINPRTKYNWDRVPLQYDRQLVGLCQDMVHLHPDGRPTMRQAMVRLMNCPACPEVLKRQLQYELPISELPPALQSLQQGGTLGIQLQPGARGELTVSTVSTGMPAHGQLKVGDIILAVDGVDLTTVETTKGILLLAGPAGKTSTLSVRRIPDETFQESKVARPTAEEFSVTLTRVPAAPMPAQSMPAPEFSSGLPQQSSIPAVEGQSSLLTGTGQTPQMATAPVSGISSTSASSHAQTASDGLAPSSPIKINQGGSTQAVKQHPASVSVSASPSVSNNAFSTPAAANGSNALPSPSATFSRAGSDASGASLPALPVPSSSLGLGVSFGTPMNAAPAPVFTHQPAQANTSAPQSVPNLQSSNQLSLNSAGSSGSLPQPMLSTGSLGMPFVGVGGGSPLKNNSSSPPRVSSSEIPRSSPEGLSFKEVGLVLKQTVAGIILVEEVMPGGSAMAEGIRVGDAVVAVGGQQIPDERLAASLFLKRQMQPIVDSVVQISVSSPGMPDRIVHLKRATSSLRFTMPNLSSANQASTPSQGSASSRLGTSNLNTKLGTSSTAPSPMPAPGNNSLNTSIAHAPTTFGTSRADIGVMLGPDSFGNVRVSSFRPSSAAQRSNSLTVGDCIIEVDGKPTAGAASAVVSEWLCGPPSTQVQLTVKKPDGQIVSTTVTRDSATNQITNGNVISSSQQSSANLSMPGPFLNFM